MVVIKGFEMPSCCADCQLWSSNRWEHYCDITAYQIDLDEENRHAECPLVEAIPKDQYEARLKADMVAMLTDIQLKVREMSGLWSCVDDKEWKQKNMIDTQNVLVLIQQKINAIKGVDNGKNVK